MFDPTVVPDVLPITHVPWADAIIKVLGAIGVIGTFLATVLPKLSPAAQAFGKLFADFRGIVPQAAAKAEAMAQMQGMTTVPQDVVASGLPVVTKESVKPPPAKVAP